MKWFKHLTDSYVNLKLREIITDFGFEGYGFYWLCLELIGQQGINFRLNEPKGWKKALKSHSSIPDEKLDRILKRFADLNLICAKSLEKGDLYIPKMKERADEWSTRNSRETHEKLLLDKNRIDKNRIDKVLFAFIDIKKYPKESAELTFYYKRYTNTTKQLLILAKGNAEQVIEAMHWFGDICDKKGLSWTLETILKWFPEFLVRGKTSSYDKLLEEFGLKKEKK